MNESRFAHSTEFSVIIPLYNEEENIPELYRRLTLVLEELCSREGVRDAYEIILVDDGSTDASWGIIRDLHEKDVKVRGISFSRNFGHHNAVLAGIDHSQGNYIILMDGDLQDRPEDIPKLIEKSREGFDVVQGIVPRRHANPLQNLVSRMFRKMFITFSAVDPSTRLGLFRCLRRPVVESIRRLPERAVFFGGIVSWVGFKTACVAVRRGTRHSGKSKYNIFSRFSLAMNAITSFSERPLIFIFQLGMATVLFSMVMFAYVLFKKLAHNISVVGWTSLFAAIFFSTGLITLSLSVVGLYISKVFIEIKQRPRYIIKEIIG